MMGIYKPIRKKNQHLFCLLGVGNQTQYEELRVSVSCWQLLPICLSPFLLLSHQMILKKVFFQNIHLPLLVIHSRCIWLKNKMFDIPYGGILPDWTLKLWYLRRDHLVFPLAFWHTFIQKYCGNFVLLQICSLTNAHC